MDGWLAGVAVGEVVGWIIAIGAIWVALGPARKLIQSLHTFAGDWAGQPARPGRPRVPGVVEQLSALSAEVAQVRVAAENAAYNSKSNGGSSAYDHMMTEVEATRGEVQSAMEESSRDRAEIHQQLDELAAAITYHHPEETS